MKFNKHLSPEIEELLTTQYKKYIKETPMTKKEMRVLREWVNMECIRGKRYQL